MDFSVVEGLLNDSWQLLRLSNPKTVLSNLCIVGISERLHRSYFWPSDQ